MLPSQRLVVSSDVMGQTAIYYRGDNEWNEHRTHACRTTYSSALQVPISFIRQPILVAAMRMSSVS